jgi:hypothetical protein
MTQQLVTDFFGKKRSAASPVAIPEAPKKKRKSKKNTILLSKTATAVMKASSLTRAECNLIGQFCGTDIRFFKVGDIYVEATELIGVGKCTPDVALTHEQIRLANPGLGRGILRCLRGKTFRVYEVERRTASRIRVKLLRTVTAYTKWWGQQEPFNADRVFGVFRWKLQYVKSRTIRPFPDAATELEMLKKRHGVRDANGKEVKYMVDMSRPRGKGNNTLVLVDRVVPREL